MSSHDETGCAADEDFSPEDFVTDDEYFDPAFVEDDAEESAPAPQPPAPKPVAAEHMLLPTEMISRVDPHRGGAVAGPGDHLQQRGPGDR